QRARGTNMRKALLIGLILSFWIDAAQALDLGDAAPDLQVTDWIKGEKVDLAAGKDKHAYVIEFWATLYPVCRDTIPHLSAMQKKYKDRGVIVVGLTSEAAAELKPFV